MIYFIYRNYLCIKRPFKTQKLFEKMARSIEFLKKAMKKMKALKNSGEGCFRGSDDEEFEDFKLAAFVLTIIRRVPKSEKNS